LQLFVEKLQLSGPPPRPTFFTHDGRRR